MKKRRKKETLQPHWAEIGMVGPLTLPRVPLCFHRCHPAPRCQSLYPRVRACSVSLLGGAVGSVSSSSSSLLRNKPRTGRRLRRNRGWSSPIPSGVHGDK
jgi:hypothetical protein